MGHSTRRACIDCGHVREARKASIRCMGCAEYAKTHREKDGWGPVVIDVHTIAEMRAAIAHLRATHLEETAA